MRDPDGVLASQSNKNGSERDVGRNLVSKHKMESDRERHLITTSGLFVHLNPCECACEHMYIQIPCIHRQRMCGVNTL